MIARLGKRKQSITTYQILNQPKVITKNEPTEVSSVGTSNIIEESFANATSNDIYANFDEELVTEEMAENEIDHQKDTIVNQENIELITASNSNNIIATQKKQDEFDIFGNFVAEVMRNMTKPRMRNLQMNIMKLIADTESDS